MKYRHILLLTSASAGCVSVSAFASLVLQVLQSWGRRRTSMIK